MLTAASCLVLLCATTDPAEVRPEISTASAKASAMILDFDEQKGLDLLNEIAPKKDLTPAEVALVQMWRGVALASLLKEDEAAAAFSVSKGCNPLMSPPDSLSPKIKTALNNAPPGDCPVGAKAADPAEAALGGSPEPAPATPAEHPPEDAAPAQKSGGVPKMAIGGLGLTGAAVVLGALAVVGLVGAVAMMAAAYPVHQNAVAATKARDARQLGSTAFGLLVAGGVLTPVTLLALLGGAGGLVAGIAVAVVGFVTR